MLFEINYIYARVMMYLCPKIIFFYCLMPPFSVLFSVATITGAEIWHIQFYLNIHSLVAKGKSDPFKMSLWHMNYVSEKFCVL